MCSKIKVPLPRACHKYTWGSRRTAALIINFGTGCQWSASGPWEEPTVPIQWIAEWAPELVWAFLEKRKSLAPARNRTINYPMTSPHPSHCTDCAILSPIIRWKVLSMDLMGKQRVNIAIINYMFKHKDPQVLIKMHLVLNALLGTPLC